MLCFFVLLTLVFCLVRSSPKVISQFVGVMVSTVSKALQKRLYSFIRKSNIMENCWDMAISVLGFRSYIRLLKHSYKDLKKAFKNGLKALKMLL